MWRNSDGMSVEFNVVRSGMLIDDRKPRTALYAEPIEYLSHLFLSVETVEIPLYLPDPRASEYLVLWLSTFTINSSQ